MPALAPFLASAAAGLAGEAPGSAKASDARALAEARARRTADDFETMFLEQSLERMVSSAGEEGPMGENGAGGPIYRSMLVKGNAGTIVKSGGVGISSQVFREIMRLQEG